MFGHFSTRIHSWGEGMFVGLTKMEEEEAAQNELIASYMQPV